MASFDTAYTKYIQPNEGGYANVPNDKGGETYAGIARKFHPGWPGWTYIDFIKRTKGAIKWNTKFPDIQTQVDQFYRDRWNKNLFGQINSQEIANLLFDYHTHSEANAIKAIQRIVNVTPDGGMGPKTVSAINSGDAAKIHDALKEQRKQFLEKLLADPSQEDFRENWLARVASFPTLVVSSPTTWAIVGLGLLGLGYYFLSSHKALS